MSEECLVCGATDLRRLGAFPTFKRVTSDVRPWRDGGELAVCTVCGAIQKPITEAWRREAMEIYAGYALYHQTDDDDHPVIDPQTGAVDGRSSRLIRRVMSEIELPAKGRMLEIGCGRGGLMRAFAACLPAWSVEGQDPHPLQASVDTNGGRQLPVHGCAISAVPGRFDLIVMNQVLEHVADPEVFWGEVRGKLAPSGRVVVQVPNIARNPFDLVVADHCVHFAPHSLHAALSRFGWQVEKLGDGWLNKELTAIATVDGAVPLPVSPSADEVVAWLTATLDWLRATADQAQALHDFGIFGTAIAALWLDGETGQAASFFCDEEPRRAGHTLLGRPIVPPAAIVPGTRVFVALEPSVAALVVDRLRSGGVGYICPAPLVRPGSP
jgi:trans-aconitate methyltransferase